MKFSGMVNLSFVLSVTLTYHLLFMGKTEGAECTTCWTSFVSAFAMMMADKVHEQQSLCKWLNVIFKQPSIPTYTVSSSGMADATFLF